MNAYALFLENLPLVWYHIKRYRRFGFDKEELFQEIALAYFSNAAKFDGEHFAQFLRWQVGHAVRRLIRDRERNALGSPFDLEALPGREHEPDLASAEEAELIRDAIAKLRPRDATIVVERFGLDGGEGMRLSSIGERHGVSSNRVREVLDRAMRALGESLGTKGGAA